MALTCKNCGNTSHPPGARTCVVCGSALPSPIGQIAKPAVAFPLLVTPSGRRYRLNPSGETLIGSKGCAVTLTEPGVSARHARVFPSSGGFSIEDLGGGIQVNGKQIKAPHALQPGDTIGVGQANLIYQGPGAAPGVQQLRPAPPPPAVVQAPPAIPPPLPLRDWGKKKPIAEGEVTQMQGPHYMEKRSLGGRLAFLSPSGHKVISVWFLRVTDYHTGKDVSVLMGGDPTSLPQMGDVIAVWGREKDGNVMMKRGYNYTTDSKIRLKT